MIHSALLLSFLLVSSADAGTFHAPIHLDSVTEPGLLRHGIDDSTSVNALLQERNLRRRGQFPLISEEGASAQEHPSTPIWDGMRPIIPYVVTAAVGNPPQRCRLLIDLTWDTLFMPSADCSGDCNSDSDKLHFFSNLSSTYTPINNDALFLYGTDRFEGELGTDSFHVAGLEVHDQYFVNVDSARPLGFISFYFGYDGVLGLAPRWAHPPSIPGSQHPTQAPSPWSMMVDQSLLDANIFALELPSGIEYPQARNRTGEISFGGISEKYASSAFLHLPLTNYSDQFWAVESQYLTWENETHPIHEDFVNLTLAGFDSTDWALSLPGKWQKMIYSSINATCGPIFCEVRCDARESMPNFTLGIGGLKISLNAFEYTSEVVVQEDEKERRVCFFNIRDSRDLGYPVDAIVLGKPFLEAFYSVFDLDAREVRLTKRIERFLPTTDGTQ